MRVAGILASNSPKSVFTSAVGLMTLIALAPIAAAQTNPLATPDQIALERQALRILASKAVQDQAGFVTGTLAGNPFYKTPEGAATLPGAVREIMFAAVVDTINRDSSHPRLEWVWSPAHRWFGLATPTSKVLMPNVDNVFRLVPVDGVSHYKIVARPAGPVPTQFSLQLLPSLPAEEDWNKVIQQQIDADIQKQADGSFILTAGPEKAAGQSNHIATTPASHFILIRDTIQNWAVETPYRLEFTRLDGPPPAPAIDEADLATRAGALIHQITPHIIDARGGGFANAPGFFHGEANQLSAPTIREGGRWGLSSSGHFKLADDEALVITLDPMGAKYLSMQLANGWLGSLDYIHHTASLNLSQTRPNADGSVTFVVCATDPGAANWLDTTGLHEGTLFVRWQRLPDRLTAETKGVREVRLVKLTALPSSLPRVTPEERLSQLTERAAAYARRYAE
jgi:hypothetical protein